MFTKTYKNKISILIFNVFPRFDSLVIDTLWRSRRPLAVITLGILLSRKSEPTPRMLPQVKGPTQLCGTHCKRQTHIWLNKTSSSRYTLDILYYNKTIFSLNISQQIPYLQRIKLWRINEITLQYHDIGFTSLPNLDPATFPLNS